MKELNLHNSKVSIDLLTIMFDAIRIFEGFREKIKKIQNEKIACLGRNCQNFKTKRWAQICH